MSIRFRGVRAAVLAAGLALAIPGAAQDSEVATIRDLMAATFDRPEQRLSVQTVTIYKDVAVAGWWQGELGGRALLRKKDGSWKLALCSGDALKDPSYLGRFGLSAAEAQAMSRTIVGAEEKIDPAVVAKFATFDGVVLMDEHGSHPLAADRAAHGGIPKSH